MPDTRPRLNTSGEDLVWRQDKPVGTGVSQLGGEAVLYLAYIVCVIYASAGGLVDGCADGASHEPCAVDGPDGGGGANGEGYKLGFIGGVSSARITIGYWRTRSVFPVEIEGGEGVIRVMKSWL